MYYLGHKTTNVKLLRLSVSSEAASVKWKYTKTSIPFYHWFRWTCCFCLYDAHFALWQPAKWQNRWWAGGVDTPVISCYKTPDSGPMVGYETYPPRPRDDVVTHTVNCVEMSSTSISSHTDRGPLKCSCLYKCHLEFNITLVLGIDYYHYYS